MLTYTFAKGSGESLYEQLYDRIKADILTGRLAAGEKLPSKRTLADHLELSVITVKNAYEQLIAEGYIYSRERSGYFVSAMDWPLSAAAAAPQKKRARKYEALPGGLSEGQQKKVWYLMYQLEKYDPAPEGVQLRDRLCGLIRRQFGVTAFPTQPFRFLSFSQGNALIEGLKSLAERKELEYLHSDRYRREREAAGK